MQYKFLSNEEIEAITKKGIKVNIWKDRVIHSVLKGNLYFCDIHTHLTLFPEEKPDNLNESYDLN